MYKIKISIKTLSPVVMSSMSNTTIMTETHSAISGSIIRGVLATRYIENKNLGDKAFQDTEFLKIFYGGLKFLPANPEVDGKRSIVTPQSLQAGKKGTPDENDVRDLLLPTQNLTGYKTLKDYCILEGNDLIRVKVKKNISMHMSRSGEGERLAGRSINGGIYNYESIDAGQTFQGEILGDKKLLEKLIAGLKLKGGKLNANIGRSRFTQYGKCLVTFGNIEKTCAQSPKPYALRLATPLIPADDIFISAEKVLQEEVVNVLNNLCGTKFTLGKIFASSVEVENFVVTWGMKRPRVMALAAGTVFEVTAPKNLTDKKIICEKIYNGFGVRTEEGFGQIRFWTPQNFTAGEIDKIKPAERPNFSAETKEIAQKILIEKFLEQIRICAQENAAELIPKLKDGNYTHFFSRLNNILASVDKKNLRENFNEKIKKEATDGKIFKDNLKKFELEGHKLYNIFIGNRKLPYEERNFFGGNIEKLFGEIDFKIENLADRFCFEYLQNYFRAARKLAAIKGGDNID